MTNPSVTVIILNWNGKDLTMDCLKSLEKVTYPNVNFLVVDNGSTDGSVELIKKQFLTIDVLALSNNLGYAGGNNEGFNHLKNNPPDYLIFLNNDTTVDQDFIQPLIRYLEDDPTVGQTVPKIFFTNDPERIWYGGGRVNLWMGMIYHRGIRKIDDIRFDNPEKTDYATGCCFCIRTKDFAEMGGFDESFSMYGEDVDLSLRIQKLGKTVYFIPTSKVWHKVSASIGGNISIEKLLRKSRGLIRLFMKHCNRLQQVTVILCWILVVLPTNFFKWLYFTLIKRGI
ncbi:MAG: glycosyltransferase family 2 protein [Candidatus Marinimicrobia bacterium]|nr:glycosyltransferase family 2 protein [Candidatus Neomarinimicrobiota bacterium]